MIICNDIMAYMFGFFFGRTPLIKLSPKKTWEGFIGGAISTVVFGVLVSVTSHCTRLQAALTVLTQIPSKPGYIATKPVHRLQIRTTVHN